MKLKYLIYAAILPALLIKSVYAQEKPVFDGPYVSYNAGQVRVAAIVKDDDLLQPVAETYPLEQKDNLTLTVIPENHPEWSFKVGLNPAIKDEPDVYPESDKVLYISDIEGEFGPFRKMLLAADVIDKQYNWTFGKGGLVIAGDLFDRGKDVVPELWLLYKLEDEAKAAGGSVHTLIGNHDQMCLSGDNRYTDAKYFKNAWLLHTDCTGLFGSDTELGRWLRSKNTIEKIGDVLVMHGGLSPAVLAQKRTIDQINTECRPFYGASQNQIPDSLKVFFGRDALFWYRGYFMAPKASIAFVDSTMAFYHVKKIIVGHTIIKWNIATYYDGRIVGLDVDEHAGNTQAVLYENGKWHVVDGNGNTKPLIYKPANDNIKESDFL